MHVIKKPDGDVSYNKNEIVEVMESQFFWDSYISNKQPQTRVNEVEMYLTAQQKKEHSKACTDGKHRRTEVLETIRW